MQATAVSAKTCFNLYPLLLKSLTMLLTVVRSASLLGARKQTCLKTFSTWHCANALLFASSSPSDFAPEPLPGNCDDHPSNVLGPARQRFSQWSSGVTKPGLKLSELMKYF